MAKHIALNIKCPECKHSLMDPDHLIHALPSAKLRMHVHGHEGDVHLCSQFGCTDHDFDFEVEEGQLTHLTCPHCERELSSGHLCKSCNAPMVPFLTEGGGRLYLCSRKGCHMHLFNFENVRDALKRMHKKFGIL